MTGLLFVFFPPPLSARKRCTHLFAHKGPRYLNDYGRILVADFNKKNFTFHSSMQVFIVGVGVRVTRNCGNEPGDGVGVGQNPAVGVGVGAGTAPPRLRNPDTGSELESKSMLSRVAATSRESESGSESVSSQESESVSESESKHHHYDSKIVSQCRDKAATSGAKK